MKAKGIIVVVVLLMVLSAYASAMAAESCQQVPDQVVQIVLVLDVSGSMDTRVVSGDLPEELITLSKQIEEIEKDPEYLAMLDRKEAIDNDPEVMAAKQAWEDGIAALSAWFSANGYGDSLNAIISDVQDALGNLGCERYLGYAFATASSSAAFDYLFEFGCPDTLTDEQRQSVTDLVPYVDDPQYQRLQKTMDDAFTRYDDLLVERGYDELETEIEDWLDSRRYYELLDAYEELIEQYGFPTRLILAQLSARTLLDLSRLDYQVSGRESTIGLVIFSDVAWLIQPLTKDYDLLEQHIEKLRPLDHTNIGDALTKALDELERGADLEKPLLIILLSDGKTNRGLSADQILDVIPRRAKELGAMGTTICTVGFGNSEDEIDKRLLENLAKETEGAYLFATRGEELASFFIACRQNMVSEVINQMTGAVGGERPTEAKQAQVQANTCELNLAVNYVAGSPMVELVDPEGVHTDATYTGFTLQQGENLQLLSVMHPLAGNWILYVTNGDPSVPSLIYSVVVSSEECKEPLPTATLAPTPTPTPTPATFMRLLEKASPLAVGLCCLALLIVFAVLFLLFLRRRERREEAPEGVEGSREGEKAED